MLENFDLGAELSGLSTEASPDDVVIVTSLKKILLENLEHAELAPSRYAVDQLIPLNEVTLFGGHGGSGKSLLALILAAHKSAGRGWFGLEAEAERVVYLSLEDPAPVMTYRLKKICQVYDLPFDKVIQNLIILDGSDVDGALAVETSDFGVRTIAMTPLFENVIEACEGAGLVIIDNASDAFSGNEISRTQVRKFIRCLRNEIARPNNAGVVLLAHIDKAGARGGTNENTYSGSTAWHNSVRSRLALTAKKDGTVELVQEKLNLGKKLDRPIPLTWVDGVLVPDSNIAEGLVSEDQEDLDKIAVLTAIEKAISDGESIPTARTGPKTTQNVLERYPDMPSHLRGRKGRDAFYKALTALQREGTLKAEDYWTAARNQSQRYIVNSTSCAYTPTTPCTEPTKGTMAPSLVTGIALKAVINETHETNDGEDLIL